MAQACVNSPYSIKNQHIHCHFQYEYDIHGHHPVMEASTLTEYVFKTNHAGIKRQPSKPASFWIAGICLLGGIVSGSLEASAQNATWEVRMDQAQVINLPQDTSKIILGNPAIADAVIVSNTTTASLTARGFGSTNMLFLDAGGKLIGEGTVTVVPGTGRTVTVRNGRERASFHCLPRCEPVLAVGDSPSQFATVQSQLQARSRTGE